MNMKVNLMSKILLNYSIPRGRALNKDLEHVATFTGGQDASLVNVRKLFLLFRIFGGLAMSLLFVRNLAGP
jgi:hypothetical protein